jgi:hypothetical protein
VSLLKLNRGHGICHVIGARGRAPIRLTQHTTPPRSGPSVAPQFRPTDSQAGGRKKVQTHDQTHSVLDATARRTLQFWADLCSWRGFPIMGGRLTGCRILVIEDDPLIAMSLECTLSKVAVRSTFLLCLDPVHPDGQSRALRPGVPGLVLPRSSEISGHDLRYRRGGNRALRCSEQ